eukprot:PhF_6_TR40898/c0_g2_i1/m.61864/K01239/iunH; purine nucleosidase
MATKECVILDHDGGVDDLVALGVLGCADDKVDLIGCIVIDADCFVQAAYETSRKLLATMNKLSSVRVAKSTLTGTHAFPHEWRKLANNMNDFPVLNSQVVLDRVAAVPEEVLSGEELLAELVLNHPVPVTVIITGPLSNMAYCIRKYGQRFIDKVSKCVVMGGAVDVVGNVVNGQAEETADVDGSAEWNIFWDPAAADVVLRANLRELVFISLDATNEVPVTSTFVRRFGLQNDCPVSQFIGYAWSMCTHWFPIYGRHYFAWDVLTTAYVLEPAVVGKAERVKLSVETRAAAKNEGQTYRDEKSGCDAIVLYHPNPNGFYDFVLRTVNKKF